MALQKQTLSVDFTGGIDRSVNDKLTLKGKLTKLENAVFETDNVIKKEGGYTALTNNLLTAPLGGGGLFTLRDLLLSYREGQVIRYLPHSSEFQASGGLDTSTDGHTLPRRSAAVSDVGRLESYPGSFDAAYRFIADVVIASVYVWTEGGIGYYGIWEATAQTPFRAREVLATDNTQGVQQVRVLWDSNATLFRIFYIRDTSGASPPGVYQRTLNPNSATPWSLSAETLVEAAPLVKNGVPENAGRLDVCIVSGTIFLAVCRAADTRLISWSGSAVLATKDYAAKVADRGVAVAGFYSSLFNTHTVVVAIADSATNQINAIETDFTLTRAFTVALAYTGTRVTRVGLCVNGLTNLGSACLVSFGVVWEDITAAAVTADSRSLTSARLVQVDLQTFAGITTLTATQTIRSLGLASKPFRSKYGVQALCIQYSSIQPALFLVNFNNGLSGGLPDVHARVLESEAGHYETPGALVWEGCNHLPSVSVEQPESIAAAPDPRPEARISVLRRSPIRLLGGQDTSRDTLSEVRFTGEGYVRAGFALFVNQLAGTEYADSVFTCAAPLGQFDGTQLYEAGFHNAPELPTFPLIDGGAGVLAAGTYSYVFVWEYYDMRGRRWLSEPSVPKAQGLGANRQMQVTVPTLRLTHKKATAVNILTYRTDANGSIYYLQSSRANDPTVDSITFIDNTPSATLLFGELLYTSGGVLPNEPLPSCRLTTRFKTRLVFAGLVDPFSLQYTEELRDGFGAGTSSTYRLTVPATCGRISGLAALDDKLIVLCERGIWAFVGDGANRAGQGDTFSEPMLVSSNIGCRFDAPQSVLTTADGVWFLSSNGLRLLDRGLSIARNELGAELGSEVDAEFIGTGAFVGQLAYCVASVAPSDKNQARFAIIAQDYLASFVLLYDGRWRQWSQFTIQAWLGMANWQGKLVLSPIIDTSGNFPQTLQLAGGTNRNGTAIYLRQESAWFNFGGVHGFQRIYELLLLAKAAANGRLRFDFYYDYETAIGSTWTLDLSAQPADPVFIRHAMARQKCAALKVSITEPSGFANSALVLSSMGFEVGIKRGAAKLGSSRTV